MAEEQVMPVVTGLLLLNLCMYFIVLAIGASAINRAIDHGFIIGSGFEVPAHFSPIYFPMGNAATGFFVLFLVITGVVGVASTIAGILHLFSWNAQSSRSASSIATIAWTLTLLAMGLACKEMELQFRSAQLRTMEVFLIILSSTQFVYISTINRALES
ncbi:hypothetical protein HHK36_001618 [Tetracentron sinense]|uniref:AWPM-19-like family protein n=1 Tax=Tetracentron sinense TaxID=13715 RepID=A0A835DRT6_TETSI|nr:hypothetical protein HHK36_001618 [Tetracentron sinense]